MNTADTARYFQNLIDSTNRAVADTRKALAAAVADFEAGYGEDYPGAIVELRAAADRARLSRYVHLSDLGLESYMVD